MTQIQSKLFAKGLPADPDTERLVLGAAMLDPIENLPLVAALVQTDDFSIEANRRIYAAILAVHEAGGTPDRIAVGRELQDRGWLESCGGLSYLVSLDDGLPKVFGLEDHTARIRAKATLRRTIVSLQSIIDRCILEADPPSELLDQASRALSALEDSTSRQATLRSADEIFHELGIEAIMAPRPDSSGIPLPWPNGAQLVPSLRPGQLIVLAGRPGSGKSAAAAQIALHAAQRGHGVAFFSLEMSVQEILQRLGCGLAGVDAHKIRCGRLTRAEVAALSSAANALSELPLYLDDQAGCTVAAISAAVRALRARKRVGLVAIDYLQLMNAPGRRENRNVEVSAISSGLKRLARELQVPVLALAQLNREPERQARKPILADLRDSGSIEQDADVVVFVHQPKQEADTPVVETEILVSKNRGGPIGKRRLGFHRSLTLFREVAE